METQMTSKNNYIDILEWHFLKGEPLQADVLVIVGGKLYQPTLYWNSRCCRLRFKRFYALAQENCIMLETIHNNSSGPNNA